MKIIDNKKDYYDYLSGVYGIDDLVVYDRRNSIPSARIVEQSSCEPFFNTELSTEYDNRLSSYNEKSKSYYSYSDFRIVIEAGNSHYYIKVERYRLNETDPVTLKYTGMSEDDYWNERIKGVKSSYKWRIESIYNDKKKAMKKISDAPLSITFYNTSANDWSLRNKPTTFNNPILKDIPNVPGCIDPIWIWQNVYDYLSSQKDKPIEDKRTDIQHLESAGFDKKTSFRKM